MSLRDDLIEAISWGRAGNRFWEEKAADAVLQRFIIVEDRDAAIERMARRFDRFFSTKYTDEDLREIAADLLDAAGGER